MGILALPMFATPALTFIRLGTTAEVAVLVVWNLSWPAIVVRARRGTPTAAALLSTFTTPRPGHTPILVVVGEHQSRYEPVRPPTIMINKATPEEEQRQRLTWGAAQLGIAQGVLDMVADHEIEPSSDLLVFVAVWIDPAADDETAVREASRAAVGKAIAMAVHGRRPDEVQTLVDQRDELTNPFYGAR